MAAVEESEAVKNRNELIAGTNAGFVCKLVASHHLCYVCGVWVLTLLVPLQG